MTINQSEFGELPFNLAGESLNDEFDAQQEANEKHVRELAAEQARKAQLSMFECGGTFDGFTCGTDADSGL